MLAASEALKVGFVWIQGERQKAWGEALQELKAPARWSKKA
jgi:hypothetical protein